ncbi:MAG: four helix bundle protein [Clostridia bacterium]|nr:four helix bundle protein [Clostridia bacterium]
MNENIITVKSRRFSIRIVNLCKHLRERKKEYILANQLMRSGTSIGANITEAEYAISKKEFLAKMQIAWKECKETEYWLDLLYNTGYLNEKEYGSIKRDCDELDHLLSSITRTTKENLFSNESS